MAAGGLPIHPACRLNRPMHKSISINTLSFAPARFDVIVDKVARLGATALSPDREQLTELGIAQSTKAIHDAGLAVATLTHRAFAFATPPEAAAARDRLAQTIDIASQIGAQSIIFTTGGRGHLTWPLAAASFAETIAPCAALARAAGIALAIEPTSHLYADASIAHRLSDTVAIAKLAGIAVIIDLFACWFDADIEAAITAAGPITALVQVSDYVYSDRGLPCRAVPGDGDIPLHLLLPAIVSAGFSGHFDLEIIGPRLLSEGEEVGLSRAAAYVGNILTQSGLAAQ